MKELFKETVWDEERKFWHRGPADIFVGDEMKSYRALKQYPKYDTVLDVGAHIGWFSRYARFELGGGMIHAVEPDPSSAEIYRKNMCPHKYESLVAFHEAAVTSDRNVTTIDLQLSHKYPANNRSDRPIKGRRTVKVATINFGDLLLSAMPELVKVDIEGAEYGLDMTMPASVKAFAIEYHQFDPDMLDKQKTMHEYLTSQGFKPVTMPKMKVTFQKITTGVYLR